MQEIEFRAWLKDEKRMLNNITSIRLDTKCIYYDNNQLFSYERKEFDEIELMQYTGIKDKNGVKIFEGDIVKSIYQENFDVVYVSGGFKLLNWDRQFQLDSLHTTEIEVIGNSYENPELLNENDS